MHFSIQRTHVHLLVEANSKGDSRRGMQGFQISAAKHLNAAISKGKPGPRRWETLFPVDGDGAGADRMCGTTLGGERLLCWRSGDHALVCDLRTQLVQRLRDAVHRPDARWTLLCESLYISCLFVIGARATGGGCWLPTSVPLRVTGRLR